jgi:hypothetical protein
MIRAFPQTSGALCDFKRYESGEIKWTFIRFFPARSLPRNHPKLSYRPRGQCSATHFR